MKKSLVLVLGVIVAIIIGSFTYLIARTELPSLPTEWEWYHGDGYSVGHPKDWEKVSLAGCYGFREPELGLGFRANFNVVVESPVTVSLEEYATASKNMIGEYVTLLDEGKITAQREGYQITYRNTILEATLGITLKQKAILFVAGGKGYVLTCTASEDSYWLYTEVFDKIVNSFVIRD